MTNLATVEDSELFDHEFFAPSTDDFVDGLVAQYKDYKARIEEVSAIMRGEHGNVIHYFITANADRNISFGKNGLFDESGAIKALDASFWSKAIHQTNLLDLMPQDRRNEWHKQIDGRNCPSFEESSVRATLNDLLNKRHQFFAERVDGIFRNLSGDHITNSPAGFGKRFIIAGVHSDQGNGWYWENHNRIGYINDLRCVIAKFMGRDEPRFGASSGLMKALKQNFGEWVQVDGNAFKIRLYKKGTAHIEVHPDLAWKLNAVLAHLYPNAIPPEFRTKPKRKPKDVVLMQKPLPFGVIEALASLKQAHELIVDESKNWRDSQSYRKIPNALEVDGLDKHVGNATAEVLQSIGGVCEGNRVWRFDYDATSIIGQIVASGLIPEDKSHQYYPTPQKIADCAVSLAEIKPTDIVLEPSAGIGNIADVIDLLVPKEQLHCVEVSQLRCEILKAKGYQVKCADFIDWSENQQHGQYDKIIMNPPFDRGQWRSHVEHAASLVKKGGRLVAILPESAGGQYFLDGFNCTYPQTFTNEFSNTTVNVTILVADKC